jgi:hypothetical protein
MDLADRLIKFRKYFTSNFCFQIGEILVDFNEISNKMPVYILFKELYNRILNLKLNISADIERNITPNPALHKIDLEFRKKGAPNFASRWRKYHPSFTNMIEECP